ncbi:unnamed protein product, partial [Prorocentrum cordatum]
EAYFKEQSEIKVTLAAARPLGQRLRDLGAHINRQQKLCQDQERKRDNFRERKAHLQEQGDAATKQLAEIDKPMEESQGLLVPLDGLGEVSTALGVNRELAERPKTDLEYLRKLEAEARAKQAERAGRQAAERTSHVQAEARAPNEEMAVDAKGEQSLLEEVANAGGGKRRVAEIFEAHGAKVKWTKSAPSVSQEEHHARVEGGGLAKAQKYALAEGIHGVWGPALPGAGAGAQAGVAILAPGRVLVTTPPGLGGPTLGPGRAAAARVSCGGRRGVVMVSVYLRVDEQLSSENLVMLFKLYKCLQALEAMQLPWIVGGGFNREVSQLGSLAWLHSVNGVATVGEADTWPRLPVTITMRAKPQDMWIRELVQPKGVSKAPNAECARPPSDLGPLRHRAQEAAAALDMAHVWGQLLLGIEFGLQGRFGIVGPCTDIFTRNVGPSAPEWKKCDPAESVSWKRKAPGVAAWATAARWARHFRRVRTALQAFVFKLASPAFILSSVNHCEGELRESSPQCDG